MIDRRSPNPRMQRTPSAPLMRQPLGARAVAASVVLALSACGRGQVEPPPDAPATAFRVDRAGISGSVELTRRLGSDQLGVRVTLTMTDRGSSLATIPPSHACAVLELRGPDGAALRTAVVPPPPGTLSPAPVWCPADGVTFSWQAVFPTAPHGPLSLCLRFTPDADAPPAYQSSFDLVLQNELRV